MKRNTLQILHCPRCHGALTLHAPANLLRVENGTLVCVTCQKSYPIQRGVPHFIQEKELTGFNRTFARLYDWFSLIYSAFSKIGFRLLGTTDAKARRELIDRLQARPGRILEVSIGPGVNLPYIIGAHPASEVYGLDISKGQLNRCNALIRRKCWLVDLFLGNAEELPFIDNSFDSVFHVGGINFFNDKKKAIEEMIRVAKPGTRIIICDENEAGAEWYERFLPGFKGAFHEGRQAVTAPVDLVPSEMLETHLENIWNGFMYCLQFRKPGLASIE